MHLSRCCSVLWRCTLFSLVLACSCAANAQVDINVQLGVLGATQVVPTLPRALRAEFDPAASRLGFYVQAEAERSLGRFGGAWIARYSQEGADRSASWPDVRIRSLATGPSLYYDLTKVLRLRLAGLGSYRISQSISPVTQQSIASPAPSIDARLQFGIRGRFKRFAVEMLVERGLANAGGSVVVSNEEEFSFRPGYYHSSVRFGISYTIATQGGSLPDVGSPSPGS